MRLRLARLISRLYGLRYLEIETHVRPHRYSDVELWAMRETGALENMARWTAYIGGWTEEETEAYVAQVKRRAR